MRKIALFITCLSFVACNCAKTENFERSGEETKTGKPALLKGGDISSLTLIEQKGGKFYQDGKEKDCVQLLADNGFNIIRLRLYNDPGNSNYTPSKLMWPGIEDEADILNLAKRAKKAGLQIELTFHYSDYWTNGTDQYKPHAWEGLSYASLKTAVYDYTESFLRKMVSQGTAPEYISIGNEIQAGLLYPDGFVNTSTKQTAELLGAGAKAVREVCPSSKVVIHLCDAGNVSAYQWFFGEMEKYKLDYDIIGASYYPFWTEKSVEEIVSWSDAVGGAFGKQILLMETGFAWTEKTHEGKTPQLSHNHPYGISKAEQDAFMQKLFSAIKASQWMIGDLYWDPIFIPAGDAGWIVGGDNVVSNATLFDFDGNMLPVFDAYKKQY